MNNKEKKHNTHSKIKNTGILFELLTRKLTSDIITGTESISLKLIEKYFKNSSELGKEYVLYQALQKQKFNDKDKAVEFLNEVISAHKNLKLGEIKKSKYLLIKEIKENFNITDFFKPKIENYKLLASIYKTFQAKSFNESVAPSETVSAKYTIIEHAISKSSNTIAEHDDMIKDYEKQDTDLRLLTYKILVEKFNEKYSELNSSQKKLIKEYINNLSDVNSLKKYILSEIPKIQEQIINKLNSVKDVVTKIKISEVCNQLELLKNVKNFNDNHVVVILESYELIKLLSDIIGEKHE